MKKVTIDRSKWRFGGVEFYDLCGPTALRNSKGYKCCLGFACEQLSGINLAEVRNSEYLATPSGFPFDFNGIFTYVKDKHTVKSDLPWVVKAIRINDKPELSRKEREDRLTELFYANGIELEFVGEYLV